jgi:nucleotide-binding universal stress UspA family protein
MEDLGSIDLAHILVGVDGSAGSVDALKWAAKLAPALEAVVVAVNVWHFENTWGAYASPSWNPETDAQQVLEDALAEAFGDKRPEGLLAQCPQGMAASALIERSASARMLVVGSRGHGGFVGLLLGSVSSACAEHARCPVLVVHSASHPPMEESNAT